MGSIQAKLKKWGEEHPRGGIVAARESNDCGPLRMLYYYPTVMPDELRGRITDEQFITFIEPINERLEELAITQSCLCLAICCSFPTLGLAFACYGCCLACNGRFLPGVEEVVKEGNEMIADTGLICRVINLQDGAPEHLYLAFDDYDSFPREELIEMEGVLPRRRPTWGQKPGATKVDEGIGGGNDMMSPAVAPPLAVAVDELPPQYDEVVRAEIGDVKHPIKEL